MVDPRAEASAFHAAHHGRLVGSLTLYVGDRDVAADLVDEAMLRAFRRWEHVSSLDAPAAWVWRVATNLATSHLRRRGAFRRAFTRLTGGVPQHEAVAPVADHAWRLDVRDAVAQLPHRQREALILRYYLELSVAETADRMDVSADAVRSLTKRAVAALRDELVGELAQEDHDGR